MNIDAVPVELRERPQWVLWRFEERDGKRTKVPYRVDGGGRASTTDPSTWAPFDAAFADAGFDADGLGYVFSADDPYVGVDLDDGLSEADRAAIMAALDSYAETSVSGQGTHVIVRATLNGHGRNRKGPFEVYEKGRFFVVTGDHVIGTPATIEERQAQLEAVLDRFLPAPPAEAAQRPAAPVDLDDRDLIDKAMAARNGSDFSALWNGDTSAYGDDHSAADLALCSKLAFWTGRDAARIDRMFRASGLMRGKWERPDYSARTIDAAIASCSDVYTVARPRESAEPNVFVPVDDPEFAAVAQTTEKDAERRLVGLPHRTVLNAAIPPTNHLVEDLADAGTVGGIAGLPFSRKTFLLHDIMHKVAGAPGLVLGRFAVPRAGPVVAVWEDDSVGNELGRIQDYAAAHEHPADLPIRWLLNEGVRLPDDIGRLAEIVVADGAVLLGLDSLYNLLAASVSLKDEEVAQVLVELKRGICDTTGCTVAIVDHSPWPTENNRGQRRGYGSVFKAAAIRWTIHLEADSKDDTRLHVEATGNNVRGIRRTPAVFDPDTLEIRLLDVQPVDEDALDEEVLAYVHEHPGEATSKIAKGLGKRRENVENALERLHDPGRVDSLESKSSRDLGRSGTGRYWFPRNQAPSEPSALFGTGQDDSPPGLESDGDPSRSSSPRRGDGSPDESLAEAAR